MVEDIIYNNEQLIFQTILQKEKGILKFKTIFFLLK